MTNANTPVAEAAPPKADKPGPAETLRNQLHAHLGAEDSLVKWARSRGQSGCDEETLRAEAIAQFAQYNVPPAEREERLARTVEAWHEGKEDVERDLALAGEAFRDFNERVLARLQHAIEDIDCRGIYNQLAAIAAYRGVLFDHVRTKVRFFNRVGDLVESPLQAFVLKDVDHAFAPLISHAHYANIVAKIEQELRGEDEEAAMATLSGLRKYVREEFEQLVRLYRQTDQLEIVVDMFADQPRLELRDGVGRVTLKPLDLRRAANRFIGEPGQAQRRKELVDRYVTEHFTEFYEFLDLIAAARFATDRRRFFVWLHAQRDWGKGFFVECLRNLGLVMEVSPGEIEKAFAGEPAGVDPLEGRHAWVMFVDEFRRAQSELKQLNHTLVLAPKNKMRTRVQLYMKLFASAESVSSLVGEGVEGQFADRFSLLSPATSDQRLTRLFSTEATGHDYACAITYAIGHYLAARVDEYKALGPRGADARACAVAAAWREQRRLDVNHASLDDVIEEHSDQLKGRIEEWALWQEALARWERELKAASEKARDASEKERDEREREREECLRRKPPPPKFIAATRPLADALERHAKLCFVKASLKVRGRVPAIFLASPEVIVQAYLAVAVDENVRKKVAYRMPAILARLGAGVVDRDSRGRVRCYVSPEDTSGYRASGVAMVRPF